MKSFSDFMYYFNNEFSKSERLYVGKYHFFLILLEKVRYDLYYISSDSRNLITNKEEGDKFSYICSFAFLNWNKRYLFSFITFEALNDEDCVCFVREIKVSKIAGKVFNVYRFRKGGELYTKFMVFNSTYRYRFAEIPADKFKDEEYISDVIDSNEFNATS